MAIDATFWVAVSFIIFFGALIYLKIPQKITEMLDKMISDIKNEIDESEKLRTEAKTLLDNAQNKLDTAQSVSNEILDEAKKDSDKLMIELNDKFHKSSEIKKNLAENKISQMKEAAIKEIKDASIKIAVDSVKKIINPTEAITRAISPNAPNGSKLPPSHTDKPLKETAFAKLKPPPNKIKRFQGTFFAVSQSINFSFFIPFGIKNNKTEAIKNQRRIYQHVGLISH